MGFLHKLWDETLAGPTPETGLGKLRKVHNPNSGVPDLDKIGVSRSITVVRANPDRRNLSVDTSAPFSPGSPSVSSPFTPGTPGGDQIQRLTWRKSSAENIERVEPRTPTVYDWVVISALDK